MKSSLIYATVITAIITCGLYCNAAGPSENAVRIPTQGNTFVTSAESSAPDYSEDDNAAVNIVGEIARWSDPATVISLYFKTSGAGKLNLFLHATAGDDSADKSTVKVTVGGKSRKVKLKGGAMTDYNCGTFDVSAPGYVRVDLQGLSRSVATFARLDGIAIEGEASKGELHYSGVNDAGDAYWTRRGPSVHLNYMLPDADIEYFYNEVTVPEGSDVNGTYFMLTGFGEGYMGIQSIRRGGQNANMVLFSVWSPYSTDKPEEIPDSLHVKVLATGAGVTAQNFGNEGSGNQWACDTNGQWHEITEASFSCDNTGRKGLRMDYNGGMSDSSFYLQNCGFVNETTSYGSKFSRRSGGCRPEIDFVVLDKLCEE